MPSRAEIDRHLQEIREAQSYTLRDDRVGQWRFFRAIFEGKQTPLRYSWGGNRPLYVPAGDLIINITWAVIENFIPLMMSRMPTVQVLPERPSDVEEAPAHEHWINHTSDVMDLLHACLQWLYDMFIFGNGFLKIGLTGIAATSLGPLYGQKRPRDPKKPVSSDIQWGGDFADERDARYRSYTTSLHRISPANLWTPPGVTWLRDSPFLIHRFFRPVEEVKAAPFYENTGRLRGTASYTPEGEAVIEDQPEGSAAITQYVELWEKWDRRRGEVITFAAENPTDPIRVMPWPFPGLEEFPFEELKLHPIPGRFDGYSMVDLMCDHQLELNRARQFMLTHLMRSTKVLITGRGVFDKGNRQKLMQAEAWAHIEANGTLDPTKFKEFPEGPAFDGNVYNVNAILLEGIRLVTGLADFMLGATTKTKSATEASTMAEAVSARVGFKRVLFERALERLLQKVHTIGMGALTQEQYIRITGPDGFRVVPFTPDQADVRVRIKIVPGSTVTPPEDAVQKSQMLTALNLVLNPIVLASTQPNLPLILSDTFRAIGFKDVERYFPLSQRPMPPDQENILLATGQRVRIHPQDDDLFHLQMHAIALVPQEYEALKQEHMQQHEQKLQALLSAGGGAGGAMNPQAGGPLALREGDRSPEGTGESQEADTGGSLDDLLARGQQLENQPVG